VDTKLNDDSWIVDLIFQDPPDARGPVVEDTADAEMPDPTGEFFEKARLEQMRKGSGDDPDWDEVLGLPRRVQLSKGFLERSDQRFALVTEKLRKVFGDHPEEFEEAVSVARAMRDSARAEMISEEAINR
jgi:hypothetical protein